MPLAGATSGVFVQQVAPNGPADQAGQLGQNIFLYGPWQQQ